MVVELKDRLEAISAEVAAGARPKAATAGGGVTDAEADVISALVNLGYDGRTAEDAVADGKRQAGGANFEKLLRAALHALTAPKKTK